MFKLKRLKALCAAIIIAFTAALSTPAYAMNDAMLDLLKILKDKGSLTQEEYNLLINAAKADSEKTDAKVNEATAKVEEATKDLPAINTDGKLEISKGENKFRIGGRLQADSTFALGDANLASEGGDVVTEFRRARIYISGVLQKYWKYKFQYDFAGQSAAASTNGFRDAYIAYTGFKPVQITFGHHKTPLSLEELTSSKYITFIERSQLVNGIVADVGGGRQYALSAKGHFNNMFTAAAAVHAGSANEDTADDRFGFTGRLTFSPIHEKTRAVHLGIGFDRTKSLNGGGIDIDGEPEIHPGLDIAETDSDDHETATTWVAEAAAIFGPFALQAEYASADIEDSPTERDVNADAWYVYGSYYLTGESRNYKWEKGSYSQTKVKNPLFSGGPGAWEIALRYAGGEFENADVLSTGFDADEADILTAALNWYPSNNIRFSANYVTILDSSDGADAELGGDLEAGATADDADYFIVRGQWYF